MAKIINFLKLGGRKCPLCQHFPFELKKKSLILPKMSRENCAYFFEKVNFMSLAVEFVLLRSNKIISDGLPLTNFSALACL